MSTKPHFPWAPNQFDDPIQLIQRFKREPEELRMLAGADRALELFREASRRVPAYKDFLSSHGLDANKIKDIGDWPAIPPTDKSEYLRRYDRSELCWDGDLKGGRWTISTTSGSTGEPFYFPRSEDQDRQYALVAEMYLREHFQIQEKSTLYVVAFPMGAWIGGLFTYEAVQRVAHSGDYSLSVITPGINKVEILKAVKNLGHEFDQIIIGSYAPFLKDIIDDGIRMGLDWKEFNLGFIFSAEAFSEEFRDYVFKKTGLKNILLDTLNHYGTVDLGTMAHETPLAVLIRRLALKQPALLEALFGQNIKLPTLAQYIPELFYFEEVNGGLYCTAGSGYPLVRYDLKDNGGVLSLAQIKTIFAAHKIDLEAEAQGAGISHTVMNLPFVFVYERSDFSVSYFAFQIYPETIKKALAKDDLPDKLTGKFTMEVAYDTEGAQHLILHIELKPETAPTAQFEARVIEFIVQQLLLENSEYRRTHEEYAERVFPIVKFWPYEDASYFKPGTKQKWVAK